MAREVVVIVIGRGGRAVFKTGFFEQNTEI